MTYSPPSDSNFEGYHFVDELEDYPNDYRWANEQIIEPPIDLLGLSGHVIAADDINDYLVNSRQLNNQVEPPLTPNSRYQQPRDKAQIAEAIRSHFKASGYDPSNESRLLSYINSSWPQDIINLRPTGLDPSIWISEVLDNNQLFRLFRYNNYLLSKVNQDPAIEQRISQVTSSFDDAAKKLFKQGWLVKPMAEDKLKIEIGDPFSTILRGLSGFYDRNGVITIIPGAGRTVKEIVTGSLASIDKTLPHELVHAKISGDPYRSEVDYLIASRITGQLNPEVEPLFDSWINEALTQEITNLMAPDLSVQPSQANYPLERALLNILLSGGNQSVDLKLATLAYSGGPAERQRLNTALDQSWQANGALAMFSQMVDSWRYNRRVEIGDPLDFKAQLILNDLAKDLRNDGLKTTHSRQRLDQLRSQIISLIQSANGQTH